MRDCCRPPHLPTRACSRPAPPPRSRGRGASWTPPRRPWPRSGRRGGRTARSSARRWTSGRASCTSRASPSGRRWAAPELPWLRCRQRSAVGLGSCLGRCTFCCRACLSPAPAAGGANSGPPPLRSPLRALRWWCAESGCASRCGAAARASSQRAPSRWQPRRAATHCTWNRRWGTPAVACSPLLSPQAEAAVKTSGHCSAADAAAPLARPQLCSPLWL